MRNHNSLLLKHVPFAAVFVIVKLPLFGADVAVRPVQVTVLVLMCKRDI